MSEQRYIEVVTDLCQLIGIGDVNQVLKMRRLEVEGFDVALDHFEDDPDSMYLSFEYGIVTSGRTLNVFRLMLEANISVYAQDQAQLGLDEVTGGVIMLVRVELKPDLDGTILSDLLSHYAEHGRYWRDSIMQTPDDMYEGLANGDYMWIRA